jgi:cytochrome c556
VEAAFERIEKQGQVIESRLAELKRTKNWSDSNLIALTEEWRGHVAELDALARGSPRETEVAAATASFRASVKKFRDEVKLGKNNGMTSALAAARDNMQALKKAVGLADVPAKR